MGSLVGCNINPIRGVREGKLPNGLICGHVKFYYFFHYSKMQINFHLIRLTLLRK